MSSPFNYLESLDEAWSQHLAPKPENAPTVISTFAGCGGSSLGYSMAGFRELLAVEWNDNAVATFSLNFSEVPVYHGDIKALTVEECLRLAGIQPGVLNVFDGSPPCQGFSTAGKRDFSDDRNQLFNEYVRLLRGIQPKAFVMENVSGMVKGKMKLIFAECLRELKASGYRARAWLLNAQWFGVPQSRERMIFIGFREDLGIEPVCPKATDKLVTVRQAIGHIPPGEPGNHEQQVIEAWYASKLGQSLRKARKYVGSFQSVRLNPDKPSSTMVKSHLHWRYDIPRQLNVEEAALLGSFPPTYLWSGNIGAVKERIGNTIPPLFMRAIAGTVRNSLEGADAE